MRIDQGKTMGNHVLVELDGENDHIRLENGKILFVDTEFDPEKHATVTGVVRAIPPYLIFNLEKPDQMPWDTDMELIEGDRVIIHYLAVVNCFKPEIKKYFIQDGKRFIFVQYRSIYCRIRSEKCDHCYGTKEEPDAYDLTKNPDPPCHKCKGTGLLEDITPINGYCLIEPLPDRYIESLKERADTAGLILAGMKEKNNKRVVYGRVAYAGIPNRQYFDQVYSDHGVDISPGDDVAMRKISDIPVEYEYHSSLDGGRKLWRVQRRDIFVKL